MDKARQLYTLQPLVESGVLKAGAGVLSCCVCGTEFRAGVCRHLHGI
jgi:hypothetical protein